ncbi:hypothetical protein ACFQ1Y_10240 [Virgibacillus alimentarius]
MTARERKYQPKNGNINRRTEISTEERKYQPKNGNINRRTEISTEERKYQPKNGNINFWVCGFENHCFSFTIKEMRL